MISGIDIEDWDRYDPAPLYSVKPKNYIDWLGTTYWFDHIDGVYCYCTTLTGEAIQISGSAIVTQLKPKEKSE